MMPTPPKSMLDFIKKHCPDAMPMSAPVFPGLDIAPRRVSRQEFDLEKAFDRHTLFRISYLPYVFFDVIWDYIETLMDCAIIVRLTETKRLSRALKDIRREYDLDRAKHLDAEHRKNMSDHAQQFINESPALAWAWKVIHSEYRRKHPDLKPDWVMLIAQADLVCSMFAALMCYARHFDKMIADKSRQRLHSILPDEVKRMQGLIPEYLGGIPHTRIRRVVDAVLFNEFLNQELTDEKV